MLSQRVNTLTIILKNVSKGFHGGNIIEYITDIYDLDMKTSVDISGISLDIANELNELVGIPTTSEETIESWMKDKGIGISAINWLLGRHCTKELMYEYTIKIKHNGPLHMKQRVAQSAGGLVEYASIYNVSANGIKKSFNSKILSPCNDCGLFETHKSKPGDGVNILEYEVNGMSKVEWIRMDLDSSEVLFSDAPIDNATKVNLWILDKCYVDDKYFTLYSHSFKCYPGKNANLCHNIFKSSFKISEELKIPLVDGTCMETPLGLVSVKRTRTINDWRLVNKWSDNDYDTFAE